MLHVQSPLGVNITDQKGSMCRACANAEVFQLAVTVYVTPDGVRFFHLALDSERCAKSTAARDVSKADTADYN